MKRRPASSHEVSPPGGLGQASFWYRHNLVPVEQERSEGEPRIWATDMALPGTAAHPLDVSPRRSWGRGLDHTHSPVMAGDVGRCSPVSHTRERVSGQKRPGTLRCFPPEQRGLHAPLSCALGPPGTPVVGCAPLHPPTWLLATWTPHWGMDALHTGPAPSSARAPCTSPRTGLRDVGLWKHIIPRKQKAFVLPCAS